MKTEQHVITLKSKAVPVVEFALPGDTRHAVERVC